MRPDGADRWLLALWAAVGLFRVLLVLGGADRLGEPDTAEVKLLEWALRRVDEGPLPWSEVLRLVRSGPNAPHGGTALVAGPVALGVAAFGADAAYAVLKFWTIVLQQAGLAGWMLVARRHAGFVGAVVAAVVLAVPPPAVLAGHLIAWGSHPEASALLGLAFLAVDRLGARTSSAVALGFVAALDALLVLPLAAAVVRVHRSVGAALAFGSPLLLSWWWTGALSASVTEEPIHQPTALLVRGWERLHLLPESVVAVLRAELGPPGAGAVARDALWALGAAALLLWVWRRPSSAPVSAPASSPRPSSAGQALGDTLLRTTIVTVPLALVGVVVLLAPRRPDVPVRYLLALSGPIALAAAWWVAAASSGRSRSLRAAVIVLWLSPSVPWLLSLLEPSRFALFPMYRPQRWLPHDLGHLRYEDAPLVEEALREVPGGALGLSFVFGSGASESPPWDLGPRLRADHVFQRIDASHWLQKEPRDTRWLAQSEGIGWGLAILGPEAPGEVAALLPRLGPARFPALRGLAIALPAVGPARCAVIAALAPVDRDAVGDLRGCPPGPEMPPVPGSVPR